MDWGSVNIINYLKFKKRSIDIEIMSMTAMAIRELDKQDWERICRSQVLPESYILSYTDKIGWDNIVKYQRLSNSFIRRFYKSFTNGINDAIKYQEVELSLLLDNIDDIDLDVLEASKFISNEDKAFLKDKLL